MIKIYNILGEEIRTLANKEQPAGIGIVSWDGKDFADTAVASGIYFIRFEVSAKEKGVIYQQVRKMMLVH